MLNKMGDGHAYRRVSYTVDPDAEISAGMVAFLRQVGTAVYATTAALASSGAVPIGTFWKDHNLGYYRATVESKTFDANGIIYLTNGSLISTAKLQVASTAGFIYSLGSDYTVSLANGTVTRVVLGSITAGETVIVTYEYSITAAALAYYGGSNYDRAPDDTIGSGQIVVVEGWAHVYTDQFDVAQVYTLNDPLRSNTESKWTSAATAYSICGRVIEVPTVSHPYLGINQTSVLV
jgi:hypothetical protein